MRNQSLTYLQCVIMFHLFASHLCERAPLDVEAASMPLGGDPDFLHTQIFVFSILLVSESAPVANLMAQLDIDVR